jgi:hypothetical protein
MFLLSLVAAVVVVNPIVETQQVEAVLVVFKHLLDKVFHLIHLKP